MVVFSPLVGWERRAQEMAARAFRTSLPTARMLIPVRPGRPGSAGARSYELPTPCRLTSGKWVLVALVLASILILLGAAMTIAPVATAYREWPSGRCRAVVTGDGAPGDCAALAPFHDVVWVSPSWNGPRAGGGAA